MLHTYARFELQCLIQAKQGLVNLRAALALYQRLISTNRAPGFIDAYILQTGHCSGGVSPVWICPHVVHRHLFIVSCPPFLI
ncbi:MAG: hypothetical protein NTY29_10430 [Proteobacteria bacterium]|nr:hypothetical protein [Pseudomonadota bacterium]